MPWEVNEWGQQKIWSDFQRNFTLMKKASTFKYIAVKLSVDFS